MSIELPEAQILGDQMREVLIGKVVESLDVKDYEKMIKIGFMNRDLDEYNVLLERRIENVLNRGNLILVRFDRNMNLLIGPEYGGIVTYSEMGNIPEYHLKLTFTDRSTLTIRLTSMGVVIALNEKKLSENYMYKRDFGGTPSPLDENFTFETFKEIMANQNRMLKSVLVGKNAVLIGLSNATFQDAIYRAGLHPKRKASSLIKNDSKQLYDSIILILNERLQLGGKINFHDLHGVEGKYVPSMGPHMKGEKCTKCGTDIEGISHGGGKVYVCPICQHLF